MATKSEMKQSIRCIPGTHITEERRQHLLERVDIGDVIYAVHTFDKATRIHTWRLTIKGAERTLRALAS